MKKDGFAKSTLNRHFRLRGNDEKERFLTSCETVKNGGLEYRKNGRIGKADARDQSCRTQMGKDCYR
jgi:hypothetical protein